MAPKADKLKGTDLVHGDDDYHSGAEVSPSISVTTTFRHPKPTSDELENFNELDFWNPSRHVYSRYTQGVSTRVEKVLSKINDGFAITYSSGLMACFAAMVHYQPKRVAIGDGYFGCHAAIDIYKRCRGGDMEIIGLDDEYRPGDLCWLETPLNPTGESRDIQYYANKIHAVGGALVVDSTFGPPPLQYPFKWGADCVMHSGTKYFGGHSDLLCGVLVVKTQAQWEKLGHDRTYMGSPMGSLESWLLLRSLRTLHLRVPRQSETATALAHWLKKLADTPVGQSYEGVSGGIVIQVTHSCLQQKDSRGFEPSKQMEGGWNATFAILLAKPEYSTRLPHLMKYFVPATSLGSVESLMEKRLGADPSADPRLVRISVGVEDLEDLKADFRRALQEVTKGRAKL
ncbi:hypothetical protein JAAARDRAFT_28520 [Jaapia argillacea MUCL 33604]|uniref:Cystathionine gamma-synthase n=1 Tax=Jaapia argillacea MUCL 33604 TaxID=933084 RepID=A0A067QQC7_9AGAM|nr:hypothetical protein JAAARDRAFT_28520 [Jaapia argillacea MUCL 33604]